MLEIGGDGQRRVLVVDDERHIVRLLQVNLQRQGHTVSVAFTGREAIGLLAREDFDLAVVDRDLPDMTRAEVVDWIRSQERTRGMRVVLLEGKGPPDDRGAPPADLFLTKPFDPSRLLG